MQKLTSLQISLCLSVLCHVAAIGGYELFKSGAHASALQQTDDVSTLTLVAAPDEPVAPAAPAVKVIASVEPSKEAVLPAPPPVTVTVATPPPAEVFHGDASSPKPGPDATTIQAQPGVKAKPNYLKNPEPVYPELARRRHQEGLVLVDVTVTPQGHVRQIKLNESSGFALLDDAALQTISHWEFEPA